MPADKAKRNRTELGSSDSDSGDIRESLSAIHQQLQKLNLLEQLTNDVQELKASVEFNNSLIEVLKADNASLRIEVNKLKCLTEELQKDRICIFQIGDWNELLCPEYGLYLPEIDIL